MSDDEEIAFDALVDDIAEYVANEFQHDFMRTRHEIFQNPYHVGLACTERYRSDYEPEYDGDDFPYIEEVVADIMEHTVVTTLGGVVVRIESFDSIQDMKENLCLDFDELISIDIEWDDFERKINQGQSNH